MTASKTWIRLIIRAVEEDLAKTLPKCANRYCNKVRPKDAKAQGWNKRTVLGRKEWFCETCSAACAARQFCESCHQLYLEKTFESSALDGKEWAQCEGKGCGRWAHVECLEKLFKKTREQVVADNFSYFCCSCRGKTNGRKRAKSEGYSP